MIGKIYFNDTLLPRWRVKRTTQDSSTVYSLFDNNIFGNEITVKGTYSSESAVIAAVLKFERCIIDLSCPIRIIYSEDLANMSQNTTQFFRGESLQSIESEVKSKNGTIIHQGKDIDGYWCVYSFATAFKGKSKYSIDIEVDWNKLPENIQYISFDSSNAEIIYHEDKPTIDDNDWVQRTFGNEGFFYNECDEIVNTKSKIWKRGE